MCSQKKKEEKNNEKQAFLWMTTWNWLTQLKNSLLLFHSKSEIHSVKRLQNQSQGSDSVPCNMGMFHMDCCSEATVTTSVSLNTNSHKHDPKAFTCFRALSSGWRSHTTLDSGC